MADGGDELGLFAPPASDASPAAVPPTPRTPRRTKRGRTAPTELPQDAPALPTTQVAERILEAIPGASPSSAVSVATLTQTARDVLEGAFVPLWVRGEVSDFKSHRNGHWYFCLRDRESQIRCVVWSRAQRRMIAAPDDGMQVVAFGQLTVYPARGDMQFSVVAMDAEGDGLWRKALELTRARLDLDGLLDPARKRPLPLHPRCVAVITSRDGAALHDIVSVIRRRSPTVQVVLIPAAVQGEGAPQSLCSAIDRLERWGGADVLIIGRGGGAREDLWAFNDERVARAVAASRIPTISAVGHEVDVTICDLVADLRAATPSAAAEAAVPLIADSVAHVRRLASELRRLAAGRVDSAREEARSSALAIAVASSRLVERKQLRLAAVAGRLNALSPLATLARGYTVARAGGRTLGSASSLQPGDDFDLIFHDGSVAASARAVDLSRHGARVTPLSPERHP